MSSTSAEQTPSQPLFHLSACEMKEGLERGEFSSVELVTALHRRADETEGKVRGYVEQYRTEALHNAEVADGERERGQVNGVLHGLPVSIKENLAIEGTPATMGVTARLGQVDQSDASVVRAVKDAGAIVLGKTNVPQLLLSMETDNPIWGMTHNPWHTGRVTGGSSGGEAAVIASGASVMGFGTDIGGSIRIPAAWCGICGLKPTYGRWSTQGIYGGQPGQEAIRSQVGPMARTVDDLELLMVAMSAERQRAFDARVPPLEWRDSRLLSVEGMVIGVYEDDGIVAPGLSVRRAVREAAKSLEAAGATLVKYTPPRSWEMFDAFFGLLSADGFVTAMASLHGEALIKQLNTVGRLAKLPHQLRRVVSKGLDLAGQPRAARLVRNLGEKSVRRQWELVALRNELMAAEAAAWDAHGIDLLLAPPTVTPAPLPGETHDWSIGAWHTMRYNLLNLPAGVVPVSRVRVDETRRTVLNDRIDKKAAAFEAGSEGLPVAAQIVGRPWESEKVMAAMRVVEAGARLDPDFPATPVDPRG